MDEKHKRNCRKNCSAAEIDILVKEIEARRAVLFGKLKGPNKTQLHRDRAWAAVAAEINAVSRSGAE